MSDLEEASSSSSAVAPAAVAGQTESAIKADLVGPSSGNDLPRKEEAELSPEEKAADSDFNELFGDKGYNEDEDSEFRGGDDSDDDDDDESDDAGTHHRSQLYAPHGHDHIVWSLRSSL